MVGRIGRIGRIGVIGGGIGTSRVIDLLHHLGIPESNAGADFAGGHFWLPSGDSGSAPKWVSLAEWFAQFSRGSSKWVFDQTGNLVEVPVGVPAFNWRYGKRGYWNEGASTNLNPQSRLNASTFGAGVSWTPDIVEAGQLFSRGTCNSTTEFSRGHLMTGLTNGACRRSYLVRYNMQNSASRLRLSTWTAGGSGSTHVILDNNANMTGVIGAPTGIEVTKLANGWVYVAFTSTVDTSIQTSTGIGFSVSEQRTVGDYIDVACMQAETGAYSTSFIRTSGTQATRAADSCRLPAAMEAVLQRPAASVLVAGRDALAISSSNFLGGVNSRLLGGNAAGSVVHLGSTNVITLASGLTMPLAKFSISSGWDAAGKAGSYNGNAAVSNAVALDTNLAEIVLGRQSNGSFLNAQNDIIAAFPDRLSNTRLEQIAARYAT